MTAWETEDEYAAAAQASLPTPTDTPYSSRRPSRMSIGQSSPPQLPLPERKSSMDLMNHENISILDLRRFTPTLHANLVSEILTLRRDQEEKAKLIDSLEARLHDTRGEHEQLESELDSTSRENRSIKRQLQLLEGGTASALSELAKERDEAIEATSETKKRLELAGKKIRSQQEEADRTHGLWQIDKDNWHEEKRKMERKLHISENRLKRVLEEVAAYEESKKNERAPEVEDEEGEIPTPIAGSETASVRTMSMTNSIRFSMLNVLNLFGGTKPPNGLSLADELNIDDDEDEVDHDGRDSIASFHQTNRSRESVMSTHRRDRSSLDSLTRPGSATRGRILVRRIKDGIAEDDEVAIKKLEYIDTGIQFSPPPSPKLPAVETLSPKESSIDMNEEYDQRVLQEACQQQLLNEVRREWELDVKQRRSEIPASPPLTIEAPCPMVSAASQTVEVPLSPPRTPVSSTPLTPKALSQMESKLDQVPDTKSSSTQTDGLVPPLFLKRPPPPPPILIPSIQLHPPKSAPATPHEPLLPQQFKDIGCQASILHPLTSRSISVQTEEIRVDKRLNFLPAHLQPSFISSQPPSPDPENASRGFSPVPGNILNYKPKRMQSRTSSHNQDLSSSRAQFPFRRDSYPLHEDRILSQSQASFRRPPRTTSLFPGLENASSDDEFGDIEISDNDYRTALTAPCSQRMRAPGDQVEASEASSPMQKESLAERTVNSDLTAENEHLESPRPRRGSTRSVNSQPPIPVSNNNTTGPSKMRRAALIHSGVAAHQCRPGSATLPEAAREPPFPIPARASSRRLYFSSSVPSDGTRSPLWGRCHRPTNSIRKVRSAATLSGSARASFHRRMGSRNSPRVSISTVDPLSPQLPPMPDNEITSHQQVKDMRSGSFTKHARVASGYTANTTNTGASSTSNHATSVVNAIAQTMVGEWMFKYVRRRKSFGVPESAADGDTSNGLRHKRWVWLAPYERAVMWSSKQPTSGSALMGKAGRKSIQSVLDVKDDTTAPKGIQIFNRSILILTAARALKFTAINIERHYIWLTALSFLAHSSQAIPQILSPPSIRGQHQLPRSPIADAENTQHQAIRQRKNPIRDSMRVGKGKTTIIPSGRPVHSSHRGGETSIVETDNIIAINPGFSADAPIVPRFPDRSERFNPQFSLPSLAEPQSNPSASHNMDLNTFAIPSGGIHHRRRSNTGPRIPPPLSFRGFSGPVSHGPKSSTTGISINTNGSSDIYGYNHSISGQQSPYGYNNTMSTSQSVSGRNSDVSSPQGNNNFFDAVGTVRMEAFVSPLRSTVTPTSSRLDEYPDELREVHEGFRELGRRRRQSRGSATPGAGPNGMCSVGTGRGRIDSWRATTGRSARAGAGEPDIWSIGSRTDLGDEWESQNHDPFKGF